MPSTPLTSSSFREHVLERAVNQLLVFHAPESPASRIQRYCTIAISTAAGIGHSLEVFTVDVGRVTLHSDIVSMYQLGRHTITCTTVSEGVVLEKMTDPFDTTLQQMVRNIYG